MYSRLDGSLYNVSIYSKVDIKTQIQTLGAHRRQVYASCGNFYNCTKFDEPEKFRPSILNDTNKVLTENE